MKVAGVASKYNPSDKVTIEGFVESIMSFGQSVWSCQGMQSDDLSVISLTPIELSLQYGLNFHTLVVQPNALQAGISYTFQITSAYGDVASSEDVSYSMVTINMNQEPVGGNFEVVPQDGYALNTTFFLRTTDWYDDPDDYPLTYLMTYYMQDEKDQVVIKANNEVSYIYTLLGQGLQSMQYNYFLMLRAGDIYGLGSYLKQDVLVYPLAVSADQLSNVLDSQIEDALDSSNSDKVMLVVSAVAGAVSGQVDCSGVPICSDIGRQGCSTTPYSCGVVGGGNCGGGGVERAPSSLSSPSSANQSMAFSASHSEPRPH